MKIYSKLLVLGAVAVHSTTAFFVPARHIKQRHPASSFTSLNYRNEWFDVPAETIFSEERAVYPSQWADPSVAITTDTSEQIRDIWDTTSPAVIQGTSLETWSFPSPHVECVQVLMKTDGRPMNANVQVWQGPDNAPQSMSVFIEDDRPFCAVVGTPRGMNTIAVRNTASLEFPLSACVIPGDNGPGGFGGAVSHLSYQTSAGAREIQGGAVYTTPFDASVDSVQILLKTNGLPLNARIELLQGPNNKKQAMEVYTEDGFDRPFFVVLTTPGSGNVVRIVNTGAMEFPLTASVEPFNVVESAYNHVSGGNPYMGGGY